MKKMNPEIVSGIITKVEPIYRDLTFVTLQVVGQPYVETRKPFYWVLDTTYEGRVVDFITTESRGWFSGEVEQEIRGENFSKGVKGLSKSRIREITRTYTEYENLLALRGLVHG